MPRQRVRHRSHLRAVPARRRVLAGERSLVEYPGYGTSPATPTSAASTGRQIASIISSPSSSASPSIILFGRSPDPGPVSPRCGCRSSANAWAASSYTRRSSPSRVGLSPLGGVANIITDRWDNRKPLAAVACRTLIIHGASDEVVPFAHAEALQTCARRTGSTSPSFHREPQLLQLLRDYLSPVENPGGAASSRAPPSPIRCPRTVFTRAGARDHGAASESNGDDVVVVVRIGRGDGVDGGRIRAGSEGSRR